MLVEEFPFDLVEVKLTAPRLRLGTVAKADVIARLCSSRSPFATVVAPAGYGKTTLLAHWAEADPRPFAWVALDGGDDDDIDAAALHRGGDPPRRAGPARCVRRVVGTRRTELGETGSACRQRAGQPRAPAGPGAGRPAGGRQPGVSGRARGVGRVRAGRFADRDREPGGAGPAVGSLAGAWLGRGDRRGGPPSH